MSADGGTAGRPTLRASRLLPVGGLLDRVVLRRRGRAGLIRGRAAVAAMAVVLLTGCGQPGAPGGGGGSTTAVPTTASPTTAGPATTSSPSTVAASTPRTETGGHEPPEPTETMTWISVAQLPMGGGNGNEDDDLLCARVRYLDDDNEVPAGVRLTPTSASFDPAYYAVGGPGCQGRVDQLCIGDGFVMTAANTEGGGDDETCGVPLTAIATGNSEEEVLLKLGGRVDCVADRMAECRT